MVPILLLSSRDVPAGVEMLIVNDPSLKGGKNSVPKNGTMPAEVTTRIIAAPIIVLGRDNPQ
jgi:hypothetical protein